MKNTMIETIYSVKKSPFFNSILALQFALLFWLLTLVMSYYIDLPAAHALDNVQGDYQYYTLAEKAADFDEFIDEKSNAAQDPEYVNKMKRILDQIHSSDAYTYMVINQYMQYAVPYKEVEAYFGENSYLDFLRGSLHPGYYAEPENYASEITEPGPAAIYPKALEFSSYQIDQSAMEHFNMQAAEGRLFSEEDFLFKADQEEMPVLLGNAYRQYFQVGDSFEAFVFPDTFQIKVIGFLEEATNIISDYILSLDEEDVNPVTLDYSVVFPCLQAENMDLVSERDKEIVTANYESNLNGIVVVDKDAPRSVASDIEKELGEYYISNGLYPVSLEGSSFGVELFKRESNASVAILLGLVLIMGIFSIFSICICLSGKINQNMRRYAIQIMNGRSVKSIICSFILEILFIVLIALALSSALLMNQIMSNIMFLLFIVFVAALVASIVSIIIGQKLRKVDIEELIRRSE